MSQLFTAVRTLQDAFRAASRRRHFIALRSCLRLLGENEELPGVLCPEAGSDVSVILKLEGREYPPRVVYTLGPPRSCHRAEFPLLGAWDAQDRGSPPGKAGLVAGRDGCYSWQLQDESLTLSEAALHRTKLGQSYTRRPVPLYRPLFGFGAGRGEPVYCRALDAQDPVHQVIERALLSPSAPSRPRANRKLARHAASLRAMLGLARTSPLGGRAGEAVVEEGKHVPAQGDSLMGSLEGSTGRDGLNASLSSFLSKLKTAGSGDGAGDDSEPVTPDPFGSLHAALISGGADDGSASHQSRLRGNLGRPSSENGDGEGWTPEEPGAWPVESPEAPLPPTFPSAGECVGLELRRFKGVLAEDSVAPPVDASPAGSGFAQLRALDEIFEAGQDERDPELREMLKSIEDMPLTLE